MVISRRHPRDLPPLFSDDNVAMPNRSVSASDSVTGEIEYVDVARIATTLGLDKGQSILLASTVRRVDKVLGQTGEGVDVPEGEMKGVRDL
jgi:hypothetical protein